MIGEFNVDWKLSVHGQLNLAHVMRNKNIKNKKLNQNAPHLVPAIIADETIMIWPCLAVNDRSMRLAVLARYLRVTDG